MRFNKGHWRKAEKQPREKNKVKNEVEGFTESGSNETQGRNSMYIIGAREEGKGINGTEAMCKAAS